MPTDKPRIAILMAVYEPRLDWLREQLLSLEKQTYPNLKLYIRDDCSPTVSFDEIERCVNECVRSFPFALSRNGTNLGSNGTFERMTAEAEGEYFAYCDQDDVWLPEKLAALEKTAEETGAELVCSDMYIIDGEGRRVADSITQIRRHHRFRSGEGLTDTLWQSNFASGCALLVRADGARAAVPFNPYMYYDHYIALFSAARGLVVSLPQPLLEHREHGDNQSSTMQGVRDKESYLAIRVDRKADAVRWLLEHFPCDGDLRQTLERASAWLTARQRYLRGAREQGKTIWKYRRFSPMESLFELALPYLPARVLRLAVSAGRRNWL